MMIEPQYTVKVCRDYILKTLTGIYPPGEIGSFISIILTHLTGLSYPSLLARPEKALNRASWDKINEICDLLKAFTPIQYILGESSFMGYTFKVQPGVLIPRPETEELIDMVIKENLLQGLKILDIGTGSGVIAISLSLMMRSPVVSALDINPLAVDLAIENNAKLGAGVEFFADDILQPVVKHPKYDIIVSNPPYVQEKEKILMSPNVLNFEPYEALFVPNNDPLIFYRAIFSFAMEHLSERGKVYLEINESLGDQMKTLAKSFGFQLIRVVKDINGKDRIMACQNHG